MSITTLKRKTDGSYHVNGGKHGKGYVNKISSGRPAFTLNDPRRVEAHLGRSAATRMRGTGFKSHGGMFTSPVVPMLSNNQNLYDPFGKARRGKPVIVPECPVVQRMTPLSFQIQYEEKNNIIIKKDLCDPTSKESGNCGSSLNSVSQSNCKQSGNYVKRKQLDYSQYLYKLKKPLTGDQSHYPPMVSRNSVFVSVPNFSYATFIQRVQCK